MELNDTFKSCLAYILLTIILAFEAADNGNAIENNQDTINSLQELRCKYEKDKEMCQCEKVPKDERKNGHHKYAYIFNERTLDEATQNYTPPETLVKCYRRIRKDSLKTNRFKKIQIQRF